MEACLPFALRQFVLVRARETISPLSGSERSIRLIAFTAVRVRKAVMARYWPVHSAYVVAGPSAQSRPLNC